LPSSRALGNHLLLLFEEGELVQGLNGVAVEVLVRVVGVTVVVVAEAASSSACGELLLSTGLLDEVGGVEDGLFALEQGLLSYFPV